MKSDNNDLYYKIKQISNDVSDQLSRRGIVAPIKNKDGTISVGHYKIKKNKDGCYNILDFSNESIINGINLPQSAALLANSLALGKSIDTATLSTDQRYGYALFEEELQQQLAVKSIKQNQIDKADLLYTKAKISRNKKSQYQNDILRSFEKLMRLC